MDDNNKSYCTHCVYCTEPVTVDKYINCHKHERPRKVDDVCSNFEYVPKNLLPYTLALRLLLKWAVECDWGLDNIRDDTVVNWTEFEEQVKEKDCDYTESIILYAKMYMENTRIGMEK